MRSPAPLLCLLVVVALAVSSMPPVAAGAGDAVRVATVLDRQGTAFVRPTGRDRWSPLRQGVVLLAGDTVRTPARGANALEWRLTSGAKLVLGPGGMVDIEDGAIRLRAGELDVSGAVTVRGPGGFEKKLLSGVLRAGGGRTDVLEHAPKWIVGYRGSTTDNWTGSLLAQVDGRDVPLSVGYHKVNVEVRDQIARTTVEQSFRNLTKQRLEGVFYFPLPAGASISGFAMWIGDELVEADIVEKQRARRIFEAIMRETKDPGLLEWSGGNLFKARVFPIEPHSDKRIRIRYTQVLPREGDTLRYRYALRSDATRRVPIQYLSVDVRVQSVAPIADVTCRGYDARIEESTHHATARYFAEETSPSTDLELSIRLKSAAPLTIVPHRRGEDGYFMLLFTPPGAGAAGWQRDLVPEGAPLDLIVVADTSASMDEAARARQRDFVQALLGLLGKKDRFRLAALDVETVWCPATDKDGAVAWLEKRRSLGWTDLTKGLAAVHKVATDRSLVVYVGDGIGTAGTASPQEWVARVKAAPRHGRWHAVSVSSAFELPVLRAIGSTRRADDDPAGAAQALLTEAARPVLTDLKLSFSGLRTARVYPAELPRLPEGRQQIVLGRFLPGKGAQTGQVVLTGTRAGKPVRFVADVQFQETEGGNSFLPRLWARRHLDALLAEGTSSETQREIVSFSEQYGILTPYTSFLVLESDAQREQYGVARRVHMRDGEAFFADARDAARREVLRSALRQAKNGRALLRRQARAEIATLGEYLHAGWSVAVGGLKLFHGQAEEAPMRLRDSDGDGDGGPLRTEDETLMDQSEKLGEDEEDDSDAEEPAEEAEFEEDAEVPPAPALVGGPTTPGSPGGWVAAAGFAGRRVGGRAKRFYALPFPRLPAVPKAATSSGQQPRLPREIADVLRTLDRRSALAGEGGIALTVQRFHGRRVDVWGLWRTTRALLGRKEWFVRSADRGDPHQTWLFGGERGILWEARRRGRKRRAEPGDEQGWSLELSDYGLEDLVHRFAGHTATMIVDDLSRPVIILTPPDGDSTIELRVDTERRVLLSMTERDGDDTTTTTFSGFVSVRGRWWPTKSVTLDQRRRFRYREDIAVRPLTPEEFGTHLQEATANHGDAFFLSARDPGLPTARQGSFEKRAGFQDHYVLALHARRAARWPEAFEHWNAAMATVDKKTVAAWLRVEWLNGARRGAEHLAAVRTAMAEVKQQTDGDVRRFLAGHAIAQVRRAAAVERLSFARTAVDLVEAGDRRALRHGLADALRATGRDAEELALRRALWREQPGDSEAVAGYANALVARGRRVEGERAVAEALRKQRWWASERNQLYRWLTDSQWERRDLAALQAASERWCGEADTSREAYIRRASVQLFLGDVGKVEAWIAGQLGGGKVGSGDAMSAGEAVRLSAASALALGRGWHFWSSLTQRWEKPLRDLASRLVARDDPRGLAVASDILGDYRFRESDDYAPLARALRADLGSKKVLAMSWGRLSVLFESVGGWGPNDVDPATWKSVLRALRQRPDGERVAPLVLRLFDARHKGAAALAFQRARYERTKDGVVARDLLARLLETDWSEAVEAEIVTLVQVIEPADRVAAIRTVTRRLVQARVAAAVGPVAAQEKLSRVVRRARSRKASRDARIGLAVRYHDLAGHAFQLERAGLLARADHDTMAVAADAQALFQAIPVDRTKLRERCAFVIAFAATRRKTPAALVENAVSFVRERAHRPSKTAVSSIPWKEHLVRLLLALDRFSALEAQLEAWTVPAAAEARWYVMLGRLRAARGDFEGATRTWNEAAQRDGLMPAEYVTLGAWRLAHGDDSGHRAALRRRWETTSDSQINSFLWNEMYRVDRRGDDVPPDLDPEAVRALIVLLSKAPDPSSHIYLLERLYGVTKDFRLLAGLPDALTGHTPETTYRFLGRATRQVLRNVHEEATLDQIVARIHKRLAKRDDSKRSGRTAMSAGDRRALILLEAAAERRAGEIADAAGPHRQRAVALLRQAFATAPSAEERVPLAALLALLVDRRQASGQVVRDEVMSRLAALHRAAADTDDVLRVALLRAQAMGHGRRDEARTLLAAELDTFGAARPAAWPALRQLVSWQHQQRRFAEAERRLLAVRKAAASGGRRVALRRLLFQTHVLAQRHGGRTSLGSGAALFAKVSALLERSLREDEPDQMPWTLGQFCALHTHANQAGALRQFATARLPALLKRAPTRYHAQVDTVVRALHGLAGARAALAFLVDRIENEPKWLVRTGSSGWNAHDWKLAHWRQEIDRKDDPLEARLLAIARSGLRRDLVEKTGSGQALCRQSSNVFWKARATDFAAVAERVIKDYQDSPSRVAYAAEYLATGLARVDRAIEVLLGLEQRGLLQAKGRGRLVYFLHRQKRWAESLPVLDKLIVAQPRRLSHALHKIRALSGSGRADTADAYAADVEKTWREARRLDERARKDLAAVSAETKLWKRAARLYEELIPLHQRTHRRRGIGGGTLVSYHAELSRAYTALGRHQDAVDSAAAAVVAWGKRKERRDGAIRSLNVAVSSVPNLDAFVARYEKRVHESGRDAPLMRKAIATAYVTADKPGSAVSHLLAARVLQPTDLAVHQALVELYEELEQPEKAIEALFAAIVAHPLDWGQYVELGAKLKGAQAERAWTSLAEIRPLEAGGHHRLAIYRMDQGLPAQAIPHWQRVIGVRPEEPDGWLGLASAQIKAGRRTAAKKTLDHLFTNDWHRRFGKQPRQNARELAKKLKR